MFATKNLTISTYLPTVARSCSLCGAEFHTSERHRKCFTCRKPRVKASKTLTPRELQITSLVAAGHANKEIAARLFITEGTVKESLFRIFRKEGVSNRVQLAIKHLATSYR